MMGYEWRAHGQEIGKAAGELLDARYAEVRTSLVRQAVGKARRGEDNSAAVAALEQLSKAGSFEDHWQQGAMASAPMSDAERSRALADHARKQKRDLLTGQFVQESRTVTHLPHERPLHSADAQLLGIPSVDRLTARQKVEFQRAYREVQDMLKGYHGLSANQAAVHFHYETGAPDVAMLGAGGAIPVKGHNGAEGLDPRRKVTEVKLSTLPADSLQSPRVQAYLGGALGAGGVLNADAWDPANGGLGHGLTAVTENEQFTPGAKHLRRVSVLSEAIASTLGDRAPARVKLALDIGQHAGDLGPQAQKVLGPVADRAAYRYRGIERSTPDARLAAEMAATRRKAQQIAEANAAALAAERAAAGLPASLVPKAARPDARELLIHGEMDLSNPTDPTWRPSPVADYMRRRLPAVQLNSLQLASGTVPPSEGIILDKTGKIVSQSVGYGDDHYLPFNLKHLGKLKGGEYIRTRTFGGPTTEDMYTGLVSGARAMTVISHNGSYTVEFDDDLKGGRRFNDKAVRIVGRYGQLLDAVRSEQVTTGGIHPSRNAELEQKAADRGFDRDRDEEGWKAEMRRLQKIERRDPKLSQAQRNQAAAEFMTATAAARGDAMGTYMTSEEMVQDEALKIANGIMLSLRSGGSPVTPAIRDKVAREQVEAWNSGTPEEAARRFARATGAERGLDAAIATAEKANVASLTPLALDAQGYAQALTALQEQFPYYVKRVEYHPWVDGTTHRDTGYVRPRHNRPMEALAGYFDPKITGAGKVAADSTRYQNFGVRQGALQLAGPRARPDAAGQGAPAGGGSPSAPAQNAAVADPEVLHEMRADAIKDLHAEFRSKTAFSPMVKVPGYPDASIGGMNVRLALQEPKMAQAFPNLHWLLNLDEGDLEPLLAKERIRQTSDRVRAAIKENDESLALDGISPGKLRTFRNDGKPDPIKHLGGKAADFLGDPDGAEYDFGAEGPVYAEGSQAPSHAVNDAYAQDRVIKPLIAEGHLPASLSDGAEFAADSAKLKAALVAQRDQLKAWRRTNALKPGTAGPMPIEEHDLHRRAEGLLRAKQLARRHTEAKQREVAVAPAAAAQGGGTEVHLHLPDAENDAAREMLRGLGIYGGDDSRTIQGS
jgi:hypothetical protein